MKSPCEGAIIIKIVEKQYKFNKYKILLIVNKS